MSLGPRPVLGVVGCLTVSQLTLFFRTERFAAESNSVPVRKVPQSAQSELFTA